MYLTEHAIDETLRCVRDYSARGSRLVFNYSDRARMERPTLADRWGARVVSAVGERFRFGWDPNALAGYLEARGFALERNASFLTLARELFDERTARATTNNRFIAIASR